MKTKIELEYAIMGDVGHEPTARVEIIGISKSSVSIYTRRQCGRAGARFNLSIFFSEKGMGVNCAKIACVEQRDSRKGTVSTPSANYNGWIGHFRFIEVDDSSQKLIDAYLEARGAQPGHMAEIYAFTLQDMERVDEVEDLSLGLAAQKPDIPRAIAEPDPPVEPVVVAEESEVPVDDLIVIDGGQLPELPPPSPPNRFEEHFDPRDASAVQLPSSSMSHSAILRTIGQPDLSATGMVPIVNYEAPANPKPPVNTIYDGHRNDMVQSDQRGDQMVGTNNPSGPTKDPTPQTPGGLPPGQSVYDVEKAKEEAAATQPKTGGGGNGGGRKPPEQTTVVREGRRWRWRQMLLALVVGLVLGAMSMCGLATDQVVQLDVTKKTNTVERGPFWWPHGKVKVEFPTTATVTQTLLARDKVVHKDNCGAQEYKCAPATEKEFTIWTVPGKAETIVDDNTVPSTSQVIPAQRWVIREIPKMCKPAGVAFDFEAIRKEVTGNLEAEKYVDAMIRKCRPRTGGTARPATATRPDRTTGTGATEERRERGTIRGGNECRITNRPGYMAYAGAAKDITARDQHVRAQGRLVGAWCKKNCPDTDCTQQCDQAKTIAGLQFGDATRFMDACRSAAR